MNPKSLLSEIGIGATGELSLRVSVGALVRVLLEHPDGKWMLALERKATRYETEPGSIVEVKLKSQPFGGAIRIYDIGLVQDVIPDFHFDSNESRAEQDFRIFIQPSDWEVIREFCLVHFDQPNDSVLESNPTRELTEEFAESLKIDLKPDQYTVRAIGAILEDHPSTTEYIHAKGYPTVRIYRIFEARILDPSLASAMIQNSENCTDQDLGELLLQDARKDGPGRANAVLTLPLQELEASYHAVPLEARSRPIWFQGHQLDETVAAVLADMPVPKYRRVT